MQEALSKDERMWAMFTHLSAFAIFFVPFFGNIVGPLVIWMIKKDEYPFVDEQGKESLNFQISITLYSFAAAILIILVVGIFMLISIFFVTFILVVVAGVRANDGIHYKYPLTIRFIK